MRRRLAKLLVIFALVLALTVPFAIPAYAATSQDVTVTATPVYLIVSNTPSTWTINDLGTGSENGKGKILTNTTYYANPVDGDHDTDPPSSTVLDAECNFTGDDSGSTVNTDWVVTWGDFSGGDANMTNGDTGSNSSTSYGAYCWYSGMTYANKVIVKSTGSDDMVTNHSPGSLKWGVEIITQTTAWAGSTSSTATLTLTINQA